MSQEDPAAPSPFPWSDLAMALLTIITTWMQSCNLSRDEKVREVKSFGPVKRVILFAKAHRQGMSATDFKSALAELDAARAQATDDDMGQFVDACCAA